MLWISRDTGPLTCLRGKKFAAKTGVRGIDEHIILPKPLICLWKCETLIYELLTDRRNGIALHIWRSQLGASSMSTGAPGREPIQGSEFPENSDSGEDDLLQYSLTPKGPSITRFLARVWGTRVGLTCCPVQKRSSTSVHSVTSPFILN